MRIYIMRHGEAEMLTGDVANDSARNLTVNGIEEVKKAGEWLNEQCLENSSSLATIESITNDKPAVISNTNIDYVLVSPYLRAQQTWENVSLLVPHSVVSICEDIIPNGDPDSVCDYIRALVSEKNISNLLIVSHLPLVSFIVEQLAPEVGAPIFYTGAIATIEYDAQTSIGKFISMNNPL